TTSSRRSASWSPRSSRRGGTARQWPSWTSIRSTATRPGSTSIPAPTPSTTSSATRSLTTTPRRDQAGYQAAVRAQAAAVDPVVQAAAGANNPQLTRVQVKPAAAAQRPVVEQPQPVGVAAPDRYRPGLYQRPQRAGEAGRDVAPEQAGGD